MVNHLQPGTMLSGGKYRIVRFIGAGGFGCTYEAEFVKMRTRVAIKEFFVNAYCNRDATGAVSVGTASQASLVKKLEEKFQREAQRLYKLQHPHIVRVSDILEENGTSYYVMDYISGRSLQNIIDSDGPLPEARALRYIGQVMEALEYVHGKSMLHLDIKPDNIMIDVETDQAILIDFGVSKQYDEVDGHNTSTIMGHTPGYAPPEQVSNTVRQFTPAADIYALGATLYSALTGKTPPSSVDISCGISHLDPLPASISPSTQRAIGMMMQPNVNVRPQSVSAARALLKMENGKPLGGIENRKLKIENGASSSGETKTAPVTASSTSSIGGGIRREVPDMPTQTSGKSTELAGAQPKSKKWLWAAVAAAAVAIGLVCYFLIGGNGEKQEDAIAQTDTAVLATDTIETDTVPEDEPDPQIEDPIATPVVEQQQQTQQQQAQQQPVQQQEQQQTQQQQAQQQQPAKPAGSTSIGEGFYLACVYMPTKERRFFTRSQWDAVSNKSDYNKLGIAINKEGQKFIVAGNDAASSVEWGGYQKDIPTLTNVKERTGGDIYDREPEAEADIYGKENTDKILKYGRDNGIPYPAAKAARNYHAFEGDLTEWYLPASGQLWLIYKNMDSINNELSHYGLSEVSGGYWSSTEESSAYAWLVNVDIGAISTNLKNTTYRVRAVAPVLVPAVPAI